MVKHFLTQQVLGYSADFNTTHAKNTVEMQNGSIETLYQSDIRKEDGTIVQSPLSKTVPFVANPIDAPIVDTRPKGKGT